MISKEEFASWGLDFTDDEIAGIRAGAEQDMAAIREVLRNDSTYTNPILARHTDIRKLTNKVVELNHDAQSSGPRNWSHELYRFSNRIVEWRAGRGGHWLPEHNPNDPSHAGKVFGVFAGEPGDLHVLAGEYTVRRWLNRRSIQGSRVSCDWRSYAHLWYWDTQLTIAEGCDKRATRYLTKGQGQFLVAIATCGSCSNWLMRGGSLDSA